ncbi:MAG: hypothetical protein J0I09_03040 [Sphingobacteriia bacterium]|nr:hypothetical protein [Sphingobacteriia bacterium]
MKFSALILSFIVLVLSCMPCRDDVALAAGKNKIEFAKSSNSQQENHKADACSPFCICSCCTGVNFSFTQLSVDNIVLYNTKHISAFIPSSVRKVALPIWQPPQLVA